MSLAGCISKQSLDIVEQYCEQREKFALEVDDDSVPCSVGLYELRALITSAKALDVALEALRVYAEAERKLHSEFDALGGVPDSDAAVGSALARAGLAIGRLYDANEIVDEVLATASIYTPADLLKLATEYNTKHVKQSYDKKGGR